MSTERKKGRTVRVMAALLCMIMACAFMPVICSGSQAFAVSKPGKVKTLKVKSKTEDQIVLKWSKVKGAKGYQIFRNGKALKRVKARTFKDKKLKSNATYKYKVRAYKTYKKTKYYNAKTKKWQTKKPKKKYWKACPKGKYKGKKKARVTCYKYGKFSKVRKAKTLEEGHDTDGDGLIDRDERYYKTSITKPDTDGDGINDYAEIILGLDPLVPDNYDMDLDSDDDGLTDLEETQQYKTNPFDEDSDVDGLTDYEEVYTWSTDPNNTDTDGDTLTDSFEVNYGLSPTNQKTDGVRYDREIEIQQGTDERSLSDTLTDESEGCRPSVDGAFAGELAENIYLSEGTDTAATENRAIIGSAVKVECRGEYADDATLRFDLSGYIGNPSDLVIAKLQKDGTYLPLECVLSGDEISCALTEDGTYCLMDLAVFLANLGIDPYAISGENTFKMQQDQENAQQNSNSPAEKKAGAQAVDEKALQKLNSTNEKLLAGSASGQADIVFAVDTTGSMEDAIDNVVTNIVSFTSTLSNNYNVKVNYALVEFKDLEEDGEGSTRVIKNGYSNWFSDATDFAVNVENLYVDGGGDSPECDIDALETARNLDFRPSASKFIILITDDTYKIANSFGITSMEQEAGLLASDGIVTSVVTDSYLWDEYAALIDMTGGIYADIANDSFSSSLMQIASEIGKNTSDGTWVILEHGFRYVKLTDDYDQDGDRIPTVEELGKKKTVNLLNAINYLMASRNLPESVYEGKTTIEVYEAKSDPTLMDTDNDGISDKIDDAPWKKGWADGSIGELSLVACGGDSVASALFGNTGHSFLVYHSFVNDNLNLGKWNSGYYANEDGSYEDAERVYDMSSGYKMKNNDYLSFSAGGISLDDAQCAVFNMEFYKHVNPPNYAYVPNKYKTRKVTQAELDRTIGQMNEEAKKGYNVLTHQCTHVSINAWNKTFNTHINPVGLNTPRNLSSWLEKHDGKSDWDMSKLGIH